MTTVQAVEIDNEKLKTVYVVPHSHHDYSWVYERQWHIMRYMQVFTDVLDWLEKAPDAYWMIDNVVHSLLPFIKNCPELMDKFKKLVTEGRIEIASGGYSLARPSYVGEESFVRNMIEGVRFFKNYFGVDNIDFFNNLDTASGQSNIPQILKLGGYKYYRFERPEKILDRNGVPRSFYWKGLDGSEILVARGFGGGFLTALYTNLDFETKWSEIRSSFYKEELSHRRKEGLCPADIEMLSYGCDDSRPPYNWYDKEIRLEKFMEEWNTREKIQIKFSTASEHFHELEKYDLPVYEGRLDEAELTFNLPVKGAKSFWRKRGELDKMIVRLENIATIASMMGLEYPQGEIRKLWYQLFEITGHAIEWINRQDNITLMNIANNTLTQSRILINEYMEKIAHNVAYKQGMCNVIVNTQSFDRYENVKLFITSPTGMKNFKLIDSNGETLEYQVVKENSHFDIPEEQRRFICTAVDVVAKVKVPAFGYNSLIIEFEKDSTEYVADAHCITDQVHLIPSLDGDYVINNGVMELTFNRGKLQKLVHFKTGRTIEVQKGNSICKVKFVKTPQNNGWLTGVDNLGEQIFDAAEWKVLADGPLMWKYRIIGKVASAEACIDIVVNKDVAALDFELILDNKPVSDGYFTIDFQCDSDCKIFSDVFFGVEPRNAENQKFAEFETNLEGQIYGRNFTAFESGGLPVALISENCSVYYIHDLKQNYLSLFLSRVMLHEHAQGMKKWFRNTTEDFRLDGKHDFKFSLFITEETGEFADIQRYTKGLHHPLQTSYKMNKNKDGADGKKSFISTDCANVVQSAVYFDEGYYIARFFESCGKASKLNICFSGEIDECVLTDFNGEAVIDSNIEIHEYKQFVSVDIGSWQIITMKFKFVN